jgi:transcriptional regulator with XRE-family HTH domain
VNAGISEELQAQVIELSRSIIDYETLKGVGRAALKIDSLQSFGSALIKARVARGWSQERLATVLDMPKQQIQRYEASAYASVSLGRMSKITTALRVSFSGMIQIGEKPSDTSAIEPESLTRLTAGYAVAGIIQDIEKRVRLRTITVKDAREIFDRLCDTYYRLRKLHDLEDRRKIHGAEHKLALRKAMQAHSLHKGQIA